MDFALKTVRGLECSAFAAQVWALWYLKSLQLFRSDHSLSKYAITTTLLITVFRFVKIIKLGPTSLITKPSVNLWPQCVNKNTVSVMTMLANPFWLITPDISPVHTKELHLTFTTTLHYILHYHYIFEKKKKKISLYLQHLVWQLDRKIPGENVHKLLEDGIPSEINWCLSVYWAQIFSMYYVYNSMFIHQLYPSSIKSKQFR